MAIPREGSRNTGDGILISNLPDWRRSPQAPVAYTIFAKQNDHEANTATTVRQTGMRSHTKGSLITTCHGDEPGTGLGVRSGTVESICEPQTCSKTVRFEGRNAVRHTDTWWMNNRNTTGKLVYVKNVENYEPTPQARQDWETNAGAMADTGTMNDASPAPKDGGVQVAQADLGVANDASPVAPPPAAPQGGAVQPSELGAPAATPRFPLSIPMNPYGPAAMEWAAAADHWLKEHVNEPEDWFKFGVMRKTKAPAAGVTSENVRTTGEKREEKCKCVVGTYDAIKNICGPLCGQQAHHIVPDYTKRYGNRAEGEAGIKRVPGLPSFAQGASICLEGNAGDKTTEHGEAHGVDVQIAALGAGTSYYPTGTAPIGEIREVATEQVKRIKSDPACQGAIQSAVDQEFSNVNDNILGRTTADNWPLEGTPAYEALKSGLSATQH